MSATKLLFISGSSRDGSVNLQLTQFAASRAIAIGVEVTRLDLRELALPIYDGDIEAATGVPAHVDSLRQALRRSDGLVIVSPEYNGFPPPLLLNAFDWLSRLRESPGQPSGLATTENLPVALLSASPGAYGGLRATNYLRQYLQMAFAMIVAPKQFSLARANQAFDASGALVDPVAAKSVETVISAAAHLAASLKPGRT